MDRLYKNKPKEITTRAWSCLLDMELVDGIAEPLEQIKPRIKQAILEGKLRPDGNFVRNYGRLTHMTLCKLVGIKS